MPSIDRETAIGLLDVQPARVVAMTAKSGTLLDDEGDSIDPRQTVPWVWALGPFGSWPERLEDAVANLLKQTDFTTGRSFRLGRVVTFKPGWGYAAKPIPAADVYRAVAAALLAPLDALPADQIDAAMNGGVEVTVWLRNGRWLAAATHLGGHLVARGEGVGPVTALEALAAALVTLAAGEVPHAP